LGVGAANAQAAGQVGSANAISGGAQSLAQNNFLANLLAPKTPTTPTPTPYDPSLYPG